MVYYRTVMDAPDGNRARSVEGIAAAMVVESLADGGTIKVAINSRSMSPCILPGDTLDLRAPGRRLLPGAVVIALGPRRLLTHRVVATRPGAVLLKGDAAPDFDGWLSSDRIIAEAFAITRRSRTHDLKTTVNRSRGLAVAVLSRFQAFLWPGRPDVGFARLAGGALFLAYRSVLRLLFLRL
jgi:hypothetical protein